MLYFGITLLISLQKWLNNKNRFREEKLFYRIFWLSCQSYNEEMGK